MTRAVDHFVMDGHTSDTSALLPKVENGARRLSMDAHAKKVRVRSGATRRERPERNMDRVQEGVEAFDHDREGLLRANKLRHIVAYEGGKQVALEPTHRKLEKALSKLKNLKYSDLFITCITPDDDVSMSR